MAAAEVLLFCGCSFIGGGIGSAVTMLVWSRVHHTDAPAVPTWDGPADPELDDDDVWASAMSWANRQGRPHAAGLAAGYMRDSAEYLIHERRNR